MRARRASTSCDTSLTILALSLGDSVVNHLARRCERVPSVSRAPAHRRGGPGERGARGERGANHFALAGEENEVSGTVRSHQQLARACEPRGSRRGRGKKAHWIAITTVPSPQTRSRPGWRGEGGEGEKRAHESLDGGRERRLEEMAGAGAARRGIGACSRGRQPPGPSPQALVPRP